MSDTLQVLWNGKHDLVGETLGTRFDAVFEPTVHVECDAFGCLFAQEEATAPSETLKTENDLRARYGGKCPLCGGKLTYTTSNHPL